jgi:hypothetical protein
MELKTGQIWKEYDSRMERFVRIESVAITRRGVCIRTVIRSSEGWKDAPRSRCSYADQERFNGKPGGYEYIGTPPADQ